MSPIMVSIFRKGSCNWSCDGKWTVRMHRQTAQVLIGRRGTIDGRCFYHSYSAGGRCHTGMTRSWH